MQIQYSWILDAHKYLFPKLCQEQIQSQLNTATLQLFYRDKKSPNKVTKFPKYNVRFILVILTIFYNDALKLRRK